MSKTTLPRPEVKRILSITKPIDPTGNGLIRITMITGHRAEVDCYGLTVFPAYDGSAVGVEVRNLIDQTTKRWVGCSYQAAQEKAKKNQIRSQV